MTVKEIARLAGVSIGTVDRVIHGRGRVSEDTRTKILSIIEESGFRPNALARHLQRGKGYVFRVLMPRQDDESYWDLALEGVERARNELDSYGVRIEVVEFDRHDGISGIEAFRRIAGSPCDGLVMAPVGRSTFLPLLDLIKESIPYVFFDAGLEGSSPLCAIHQDPFHAGWLAGRMMVLLKPGASNLAVINTHPEDSHLKKRVEGFLAYYESLPETTGKPLIREYRAENRDKGGGIEGMARQLRREYSLPEGIYVCNANAASFLKSLDLDPEETRPGMVGHDLVPANRELLAQGKIDCLISQKPELQTYRSLQVLYRKVVLGEDSPAFFEAPLELCFRENLTGHSPLQD